MSAGEPGSLPTPAEVGFPTDPGRRSLGNALPLILALAGLLLAYWLVADEVRSIGTRLFPAEGLSLSQVLLVILGGPVVLWAVILVHESGHVAGGLAGGFRFQMMAAGPLVVSRETAGLSRAWRKRLSIRLNRRFGTMAGYSVCTPDAEGSDLAGIRTGMIRHVAGGPASSLVAGLIVITVLLAAGEGPGAGDRWLDPGGPWLAPLGGWESVFRALALLFAAGSIVVGVATLIPISAGPVLNDGARLLQLARDDARTARDLTLLTISALAMSGRRPRSWPADLLEKALKPRDRSAFAFWARRYRHLNLWDLGQQRAAREALCAALEDASGLDPGIQRQAAWDAARFGRWGLRTPRSGGAWMAYLATANGGPLSDEELAADPEPGVALFLADLRQADLRLAVPPASSR